MRFPQRFPQIAQKKADSADKSRLISIKKTEYGEAPSVRMH